MHAKVPLVPEGFEVPTGLEPPAFRLRMRRVNDVVKDDDAVMSSRDHLRRGYSWVPSLSHG